MIVKFIFAYKFSKERFEEKISQDRLQVLVNVHCFTHNLHDVLHCLYAADSFVADIIFVRISQPIAEYWIDCAEVYAVFFPVIENIFYCRAVINIFSYFKKNWADTELEIIFFYAVKHE